MSDHTLCLDDALRQYLLACDREPRYTAVGEPFWTRAGVRARIELAHGQALDILDQRLADGAAGSYDFAFIDADKINYDNYYERCLKLLKTGGLMAFDNMLWNGRVARPANPDRDPDTAALQRINVKLHADNRVDLAMVPVGDGLTLARKR